MCLIGPLPVRLALVGGPAPLVIMQVACLHDIHLVLIDQIFKMKRQGRNVCVFHLQRRVEGPMYAQNDPFDVGIRPGCSQVRLKVFILLAVEIIGVLR